MAPKKRMKENFGDVDKFDEDDITDSDDQYSDTEKRLLEKVRKRRVEENFDSDDEVYGLNLQDENDDDEKDSMASDIERPQEDDDLPDERAWGKKKSTYFSTDYVDPDYATTNQKDLAEAEFEEEEARKIQQRLAEQMDEDDFGLELLQPIKGADEQEEDDQIVKTDLSMLSKREKIALFRRESPEFEPLVKDLLDRLKEVTDILDPFLELVKSKNIPNSAGVEFIKTKYELSLVYCTNITFYLMLKARRTPVTHHPVIKRLAQFRLLLSQLEKGQGDLLEQVAEIVEADREGKPIYSTLDNSPIQPKSNTEGLNKKINKKVQKAIIAAAPVENEEEDIDDEEISMNEEPVEEEEMEVAENHYEILDDQKRPITYQIAKNRGLTPHRKKELRNPRVKHRNKYRKAKIRRKGAVREVRTETTRYDGERSGIRASVVKSVKIK